MRKALVNGVELEYDIFGDGEPLLCISPVIADGFRPLIVETDLAERHRIVTYRKRGWGGSTHTAGPVSVADHAADAAALMAHLGLARAHVAGHSSGAAVALQLAINRPELVETIALFELSLLSAPVPGASALLQKAAPAFDAYAAGRAEDAIAIFLSVVCGLEWDACRALLDRRVPGAVRLAIEDADTFFGVELPALQQWTFGAADAAKIAQPILSVLGQGTQPFWIEVTQLLRSWFPDMRVCPIAGVGHLLHIQEPAPVASGLSAFLAQHPMDPSVVAQAFRPAI